MNTFILKYTFNKAKYLEKILNNCILSIKIKVGQIICRKIVIKEDIYYPQDLKT